MKKLLPLLLLVFSGCATLTASGNQDIGVATEPAGAACVLANTQQSVTVEQTPGIANVQRMFEPLEVTCTLPGYAPVQTIIEAKTRGRAWGNILLLGVPALVDTANGKGYEYVNEEVTLVFPSPEPAVEQ